MLQRAASNAYSWWWATQIRTKQSKWLENSLQDMEEKVEAALKLLEDDGDSFAKKANMYYKRRPEVITFVQETHKQYKGLAERYDRISGELHKANNTIATIFPDQQFGMDDDEEDSSPKATTPNTSKFRKAAPPAPPTTLTKAIKPKTAKEKPKQQKKKKANPYATANPKKAREQIDKLQKEILVLQTEKEFIKGAYENGLAKYWDIEKKITEMQDKVCCLQDEYGEDAVIEDDEARALMAVTALRSCEDTLVKLQDKQKQMMEEARQESERIKNAKDRLIALKREHGQLVDEAQDPSEETLGAVSADSNMGREMSLLNQERLELQSMCEKVRKSFQTDSEVTVLDLAEKIDELVSKVIALETTESLQVAQIQRLKAENDEFHKHLQTVEEEKATLIGDSEQLNDKMKQVEKELHGLQELYKTVRDERNKLRKSFSSICHTFNDLSNKLQSPEKNSEAEVIKSIEPVSTPDVELQGREKSSDERETALSSQERMANDPANELVVTSTKRSVKFADQVTGGSDVTKKEQEAEVKAISTPESIKEEAKNPGTVEVHNKQLEETKDSENKGGVDKVFQMKEPHESSENKDRQQEKPIPLNDGAKAEGAERKEEVSEMDSDEKNNNHDGDDDTPMPDWQELLTNGLEDREKVLLGEYTSILRNFKEAKRKLSDTEKKNQDYVLQTRSQIRDLKNTIVMKDEEIRSLQQKLNFMEGSSVEEPTGNDENSNSPSTRKLNDSSSEQASDENKLGEAEESRAVSSAEEKFRRDIDELLQENLEFWIRFSTSFQQIQRYQIAVQTVQAEVAKLKEVNKKQEGGSVHNGEGSTKSEASLLYKQLNDVQTDLSIWIEQNGLLTEELHSRFSSLGNILEEILRVSKDEPQEGEVQFAAYHASKLQGEVLSMQQENNKVADELQAGLIHVKSLQADVEKSLERLEKKFGLAPKGHNNKQSSKTKVPLKSFLFGSKPKKQSIFACVNPAMQRPFIDLLQRPPR